MARVDKFGNEYELVSCKANKNGFPVGYVEIGPNLFKIEPSDASAGYTDKKGREVLAWVKLTKMKKRPQASKKRGF